MKEIKKALEELEERIEYFEKLKANLSRCFICGSKETTQHHTRPLKIKNNDTEVPLCRECHNIIEIIRTSIECIKGEKKLSITRFKQILNAYNVTI